MGAPGSNPTFSPSFRDGFLFPLLKNSKSGVDDPGHRFRSGSPLTNYPNALSTPCNGWNIQSFLKVSNKQFN